MDTPDMNIFRADGGSADSGYRRGAGEISVEKIIHPEAVDFSALTVVILVGSILVKLWMSFFFGSLGKRIHSLTLEATRWIAAMT